LLYVVHWHVADRRSCRLLPMPSVNDLFYESIASPHDPQVMISIRIVFNQAVDSKPAFTCNTES